MATPSASLAFAELAPHSLHLAVLSGKKVVAVRAFSLEAKADLAAFVAEHHVAGLARASVLGVKNYLHLSADSESGAVRQPAALLSHVTKLPHGLDGSPVAVVCDAANGAAVDPVRVSPWLLAAADSGALTAAKETLSGLGLAASEFTLAAPQHFGVVASSLSGDEVALVIIPGEAEASLAWVGASGVQAVASAPAGYTQLFEAVQQGLGLKFKAAAGKLFYNDNYDFSDAAPKITASLAEALRPSLATRPAACLYLAGLTPGQAWLVQNLAPALGLKPLAVSGAALATRFGLDAAGVSLSPASGAVLSLAAAGAGDAAWVQPTLEVLSARAAARPKTNAPFPKAAAGPASAAAAATASAAPAAKAAQPVVSVAVEQRSPQAPGSASAAPAAAKSNKGPIFVAGALVAVAAIVGLAMTMRGQKTRPEVDSAATSTTAPATTSNPTPTSPTPPPVTSQPPSAPIDVTPPRSGATPTGSGDLLSAESRKFANARYRLEVTEKGFIQALSTSRDEVLVESAAGISLQGSYVGTDGRRKWFNVGGVDDAGYRATVQKQVSDGGTVFNVKVTHPRFELEQSFLCLADTVKVSVKFTPINLRDPRGVIAAVHSVRLSPVALNPAQRMRPAEDSFTYAMRAGTLQLKFDNGVWARDAADGKQTVIAGENGVAFHFTENSEASRNQLNYEIALP
jgi:hypothetical protein